jgi:RNA polymerase sigma-70 factor (ECF subfamily)
VQFHTRQQRDVARTVPLADEAEQIRAEVRSEISRLRIKEEARLLERAFEALSESQREVILLRKYEELSFQEIGERLGKSAAASRMMFARAMSALTRNVRELERTTLAWKGGAGS